MVNIRGLTFITSTYPGVLTCIYYVYLKTSRALLTIPESERARWLSTCRCLCLMIREPLSVSSSLRVLLDAPSWILTLPSAILPKYVFDPPSLSQGKRDPMTSVLGLWSSPGGITGRTLRAVVSKVQLLCNVCMQGLWGCLEDLSASRNSTIPTTECFSSSWSPDRGFAGRGDAPQQCRAPDSNMRGHVHLSPGSRLPSHTSEGDIAAASYAVPQLISTVHAEEASNE